MDVGVPEKKVGDLKSGIHNYSLIEKYILSSDKFSDEKCLTCSVFPICSGGCNKYRMDSSYTTADICPLSPSIISKFFNIRKGECL